MKIKIKKNLYVYEGNGEIEEEGGMVNQPGMNNKSNSTNQKKFGVFRERKRDVKGKSGRRL